MFSSPCNKPGEQIASDNATHVRTVTRYSRTVQEQNSFNPNQTDLQVFNIDDFCYLLIFLCPQKIIFCNKPEALCILCIRLPSANIQVFRDAWRGTKGTASRWRSGRPWDPPCSWPHLSKHMWIDNFWLLGSSIWLLIECEKECARGVRGKRGGRQYGDQGRWLVSMLLQLLVWISQWTRNISRKWEME